MTTKRKPKWWRAAEADGYDMSDPFDAVTVAAFVVGPNIRRIAKVLGMPRTKVAPVARSLRGGGVWRGSKLVAEGDDIGMDVALHGAVARGWLIYERRP